MIPSTPQPQGASVIDLDALEADAREGDRQGDARYPYVMEYEEALTLIAELRAARKVVEATQLLDRFLEVQAAVQPTSKKVHDAWGDVRAALADYEALKSE